MKPHRRFFTGNQGCFLAPYIPSFIAGCSNCLNNSFAVRFDKPLSKYSVQLAKLLQGSGSSEISTLSDT